MKSLKKIYLTILKVLSLTRFYGARPNSPNELFQFIISPPLGGGSVFFRDPASLPPARRPHHLGLENSLEPTNSCRTFSRIH